MADNAFVTIGAALLKHQIKKLVGEETLGVISEELANIGGDKLDTWLSDKSAQEEIEKAAKTAEKCFHDSVGDHNVINNYYPVVENNIEKHKPDFWALKHL